MVLTHLTDIVFSRITVSRIIDLCTCIVQDIVNLTCKEDNICFSFILDKHWYKTVAFFLKIVNDYEVECFNPHKHISFKMLLSA